MTDPVPGGDCARLTVRVPPGSGSGPDLELLGAVDLAAESDFEHADVTGTVADGSDVMVTWVGYDGAGDNPLTFGSRLHYDGAKLQLLDTFACRLTTIMKRRLASVR